MVSTDKVEQVYQQHFCQQPIMPNISHLIFTTVAQHGEDAVLNMMRELYRRGTTDVSFAYIARALDGNAARDSARKARDPVALQDDSFKSDAQKEREKQWLRDGVARSRRALSVKGYLSGLAREAAGKETVLAIDSWVKNGGKRPDEAIKRLGEFYANNK
uniref:Uncharacterized protein n=1 Tax=Firmicutes phage HS11 TaxID=3056393 RepID=A0AA49X8E5_9VIRU|nr:MAG: hypothetical protein [Firmicutes phage HS11]